LKQKVEEVKREIKKKELPIEKVLRTLEAGVWKEEGTEEPYEGLPEASYGGPLGKIVSTVLQVSDILADFIESYKKQFLDAFFESFLQKMKELYEAEEKGEKDGGTNSTD